MIENSIKFKKPFFLETNTVGENISDFHVPNKKTLKIKSRAKPTFKIFDGDSIEKKTELNKPTHLNNSEKNKVNQSHIDNSFIQILKNFDEKESIKKNNQKKIVNLSIIKKDKKFEEKKIKENLFENQKLDDLPKNNMKIDKKPEIENKSSKMPYKNFKLINLTTLIIQIIKYFWIILTQLFFNSRFKTETNKDIIFYNIQINKFEIRFPKKTLYFFLNSFCFYLALKMINNYI
jgi:hypothetical protein